MKYGGKVCGETSETKSCHIQACEKDCELGQWTKWSLCSKDCDGGTQKRQKFVKVEPLGAGKCAGAWSVKRLQYKKCHMHRCVTPQENVALACNRSLDVVLLIDGSGSLGQAGWNAEIIAAQRFVDAFKDSGKANMGVILFSGPRTWSGVKKCTGKNSKTVSPEYCGIKIVTHFTKDMKKVKQSIKALAWPKGSTLTSLALLTAKTEMGLGRQTSPSSVVVFTDGRPLSYRKTGLAAEAVRKSSRLLWVPVTRYAPLKAIKKWATRRWEENVVPVTSFKKLEDPEVITHIIADICPSEEPKLENGRATGF